MATAANVINQVLDRLFESRTSPVFWTRTELLQYLNDGYLELTLMAGQLTSERAYTMVASKFQAVPSGAMAVIHVEYASQPVEKSSIEDFDRLNPTWDTATGVLKKWAPCGVDQWVCDKSSTIAEAVTLTTLDQPTTLTETTTIDLDAEYIDALEFYVFHQTRFKESGGELQQAMTAYDDFTEITGHREERTMAAQWLTWSRDPDSDTGLGYSTLDRS